MTTDDTFVPATSGSTRDTAIDRPPVPPQKPLALDCCDSGCSRCVFEIYADDLAHYQSLLAQWRARNPGCDPPGY